MSIQASRVGKMNRNAGKYAIYQGWIDLKKDSEYKRHVPLQYAPGGAKYTK